MKQETKELVRWIKNHISVANNKGAELYLHKAFDFLDSLPDIEKKLCFGGYVQDINGTTCCHGDKVKLDNAVYTLYWSKSDYRFYLKEQNPDNSLHLMSMRIEKVKE